MLASQIERCTSYEENESMRIFVVEQGKLWEEGFDADAEKYVGSKWGKYLRAPSIFFKILEKGKDLFVPLKAVAEVRFGIKTGANEFFYLTEEQIKAFGIEREFWMHPLQNLLVPLLTFQAFQCVSPRQESSRTTRRVQDAIISALNAEREHKINDR